MDGNSNGPVITYIDSEVLDEFKAYADREGLVFEKNADTKHSARCVYTAMC